MNNNLVELTLEDNIEEKAADFLIDKDVECFVRENKPLTQQAYKQLKNIANLCRETELYNQTKQMKTIPDTWYKLSARKFLEDMLYRISVDDIDTVAVVLRVAFPFFQDKYDKEYKGKCYEEICSQND